MISIQRIIFTLLMALLIMNGCIGQTQSLATSVLPLENFDFSTSVHHLLPADTRDTEYDGMYNIKSTSLQKFTSRENDYTGEGKPLWVEYRQFSSRSSDEIARYADLVFNTFNIVVSLDEEIMVFNGIASDLTQERSDEFVALLNEKHGQAKKSAGAFMESFDVYTWQLKDRILKYVPLYDDEHNTLVVMMDKENNTLQAGEKSAHYRGLFYVIQAKHAEEVIGHFHTGDLLYCQ